MLKTKIKNILGPGLLFLTLCLVMEVFGSWIFPVSAQNQLLSQVSTTEAAPAQPMVLGTSTTVQLPVATPTITVPQQTGTPDFSSIKAESFLVYDAASGQILAQKDPDLKTPIASLTKLLTGLIAYEQDNLNATVTIPSEDELPVAPDLGLRNGAVVELSDLFKAMLIGSANDAALALANATAAQTGQNFVGLMNATALRLGMTSSSFENPMGFDSPQNYSTANDIRKLVDFTSQIDAFSSLGHQTGYSFTGQDGQDYHVTASNRLVLTHPEIQAVKTGLTPEADGAMVTKITENGHSIIVIVLHSTNREQDTLTLENQIFSNFSWDMVQ